MIQAASIKLNIAVCDDEEADCKAITGATKELLDELGVWYHISEYTNAAGLLEAIRLGNEFQLLLLDVMMEGTSGMALAAQLRQAGNRTMIVFISSDRELAMCGYEVSAARYLAKPLDREKLKEALQYCCQDYLANREIVLPSQKGRDRIMLSKLIFAEAQEREIRLVLIDRERMVNMKFTDLVELLPKPQFLQIHRSYIVNLSYGQALLHREMQLQDGRVLPVSKYRYDAVKQLWTNYLNG